MIVLAEMKERKQNTKYHDKECDNIDLIVKEKIQRRRRNRLKKMKIVI